MDIFIGMYLAVGFCFVVRHYYQRKYIDKAAMYEPGPYHDKAFIFLDLLLVMALWPAQLFVLVVSIFALLIHKIKKEFANRHQPW